MAGYCKYFKLEESISTDGGVTWISTGQFKMGALMEENSSDCGYELKYKWETVQDEYICEGTTKYEKEEEYISYNGGETWDKTGEIRKGSLIEENSKDCGYVPEPQYKWETVQGEYICEGTTKYGKEEEYISTDEGQTWNKTGQTRKGSLIEENSKDCGYEPEPERSEYYYEYLTIEAKESGYIFWSGSTTDNNISVSRNGGDWNRSYGGNLRSTVSAGDKLRYKGNCSPGMYGIGSFSASTIQFDVYGNAHSLLYGDDFVDNDKLIGDYTFSNLFMETKVVDASNLILPATTLANSCYDYMFYNCASLKEAPELPATTLAQSCYNGMFRFCDSLTKAPELPATTLAQSCYYFMFDHCTALNKITTMQLDAPNSVSDSQYYWVSNVAKTGTIYLNNNITWNPDSYRGNSGIPVGWTVIKI